MIQHIQQVNVSIESGATVEIAINLNRSLQIRRIITEGGANIEAWFKMYRLGEKPSEFSSLASGFGIFNPDTFDRVEINNPSTEKIYVNFIVSPDMLNDARVYGEIAITNGVVPNLDPFATPEMIPVYTKDFKFQSSDNTIQSLTDFDDTFLPTNSIYIDNGSGGIVLRDIVNGVLNINLRGLNFVKRAGQEIDHKSIVYESRSGVSPNIIHKARVFFPLIYFGERCEFNSVMNSISQYLNTVATNGTIKTLYGTLLRGTTFFENIFYMGREFNPQDTTYCFLSSNKAMTPWNGHFVFETGDCIGFFQEGVTLSGFGTTNANLTEAQMWTGLLNATVTLTNYKAPNPSNMMTAGLVPQHRFSLS